jgi:hypothetical protein
VVMNYLLLRLLELGRYGYGRCASRAPLSVGKPFSGEF